MASARPAPAGSATPPGSASRKTCQPVNLCHDYTDGFWFIQSDANNLYVSAELGYTGGNYGMLRARATSIGPWEQYVTANHQIGC